MTLRELKADLKFGLVVLIVIGFLAWIGDLEKQIAEDVQLWNETKARIEKVLTP